jgi:hypothetical protein
MMLPLPSPHSTAHPFSHFDAAERRQVAFRNRYLFLGVVLVFTSILVIAFVVNVGSSFLHPPETRYAVRAARPTLATLATSHQFNAAFGISGRNATGPLQQQPATLVPSPIAFIITALGPAEIASLVQGMGETLSPLSSTLHANKITGAILLE